MLELGREGFLAPADAFAVLRRLAEAHAPVTLGGVTPGFLSLDEQPEAVTVLLSGTPIVRLDRSTFRGGWCTGPRAHAPFWDVALDLHGDGCEGLGDRLRYRRSIELQHPRMQVLRPPS